MSNSVFCDLPELMQAGDLLLKDCLKASTANKEKARGCRLLSFIFRDWDSPWALRPSQGLLNRIARFTQDVEAVALDRVGILFERDPDAEKRELAATIIDLGQAMRVHADKNWKDQADTLTALALRLVDLNECPICQEDLEDITASQWASLPCCKKIVCQKDLQDWQNTQLKMNRVATCAFCQ